MTCEGRLAGRRALVTGGVSGIGRATVERLIAEGAVVLATDRHAADHPAVVDLTARLGNMVAYLPLDVTSEEAWASALGWVEANWGALHILVNNAGVGTTGPLATFSLADWNMVMAVNTTGVFLGTRTFTELMTRSGADVAGGASIVNISSIYGIVGAMESGAYNASKGAVRLFTKSAAIEFGQTRRPVRVNSVHPGFIRTPMLETGADNFAAEGRVAKADDFVAILEAQTAIGRLGLPAEIAAGVAFLASADASFMTGSELVIDGGTTAM
ncbi:SDR family NAD(P)-dependent oxidoreductase [Parapedomonas caeni]|jgi:NAD(P)-dependent dehydrogenase (short-subunit alcohol dehydrogenase family)